MSNHAEDYAHPSVRYCDEDGTEFARGTPAQLAAKIRELRAIIADRVECSGCGGWFPFTAMLPATAQPEAAMICRGCAVESWARVVAAEFGRIRWTHVCDSETVNMTAHVSAFGRLASALDAMKVLLK